MPSGHAESVFYSTMFIHLSLKNYYITGAYFILSIYTCYQRIETNSHSIMQILMGLIIGLLVGYFMYYMSSQKISGIIKMKKDDNAPL